MTEVTPEEIDAIRERNERRHNAVVINAATSKAAADIDALLEHVARLTNALDIEKRINEKRAPWEEQAARAHELLDSLAVPDAEDGKYLDVAERITWMALHDDYDDPRKVADIILAASSNPAIGPNWKDRRIQELEAALSRIASSNTLDVHTAGIYNIANAALRAQPQPEVAT